MPQSVKASPDLSLVSGFFTGVFACVSVSLVAIRMGVDSIQTIVFSLLGGFCAGAFVYRERSLVSRVERAEWQRLHEVGAIDARLEHLYYKSLASLVEFDAGTRIIRRASLGFFDLLGLRADVSLSGQHLEDVLGIEASRLETLVEQMKRGEMSVREELTCKHSNGKSIRLLISGNYLSGQHMIEAVFCLAAWQERDFLDLEQTQGDLERFRKGMVRREERILELKREVNELLAEAGDPVRYQVDQKSSDTRFVQVHARSGRGF